MLEIENSDINTLCLECPLPVLKTLQEYVDYAEFVTIKCCSAPLSFKQNYPLTLLKTGFPLDNSSQKLDSYIS